MRKTIGRLLFELSLEELWEEITASLLQEARPGVAEDTLLVLNLSDLNKPYVRSMEYLDWVHGGSIGTEGDGY